MSERLKFVMRLHEGERMTDLCAEFGISRKTGHKMLKRFEEEGAEGLFDRSRAPRRSPYRTSIEVTDLIIAARQRYPTWGPKKLKVVLEERNRGVRIPAASTIGVILEDAGLVDERKRRRRAWPSPVPLRESSQPNDIWSMDFKGQFKLGNGQQCYPLTVCDHFSRFVLGCDGLESTRLDGTLCALRLLFKEFGLPLWMRSDNGSPFASVGLGGLSKLSVWLMRVGVNVERIEPGHPEQNGRHERMHRDLKQETTRPPGANLLQQQERFDDYRAKHNDERPHEALDMKRPAELYISSPRPFIEASGPIEYPLHDIVLSAYGNGEIFLPIKDRPRVTVGQAFAGQELGLREVATGTWLISFMHLDLGYVDAEARKIVALPVRPLPAATPANDIDNKISSTGATK